MNVWAARSYGLVAFFIAFSLLLSGCGTSLGTRNTQAFGLAAKKNWTPATIRGGKFQLQAFLSPTKPNPQILTIYIEGDGYAWVDRFTLSDNPTPINPIGLKLAVNDSGNAVYLARPCQYVEIGPSSSCSPVFWSSARFSKVVITSYQNIIDKLMIRRNAATLRLVGYSGGGVVAALIAANRGDVQSLSTYGAPLDIDAWVKFHRISPIRYSLKPLDYKETLRKVPQIHYVGTKDNIVPPEIVRSYLRHLGAGNLSKMIILKNINHECCWTED